MSKRKPLISICVPVFDEADNILDLYNRIKELANNNRTVFNLELIFTDNASRDGSWTIIQSLASDDKMVRGYRFGRNIGYQKSILNNFSLSNGDVVVQLDADLQDPPELIPQMLDLWRTGIKVVSGQRVDRSEGLVQNKFREVGYWLLAKASKGLLKPNVGDFRLLDQEVVRRLIASQNPAPYLRGMISKFGFSEKTVSYRRSSRVNGKSKFTFFKVLSLGWRGFLTFSTWPMSIMSFFVLISGLFAIASFSYSIFWFISNSNLPAGYFSLFVMLSFILFFVSFAFSICLFYLRNLYELFIESVPVEITDTRGKSIKIKI